MNIQKLIKNTERYSASAKHATTISSLLFVIGSFVIFNFATANVLKVNGQKKKSAALSIYIENSSSVKLEWGAISGSTGYSIYRNGVWLASAATNSYTDSTLKSGGEYSYTVYSYQGHNSVYTSEKLNSSVKIPNTDYSESINTEEKILPNNSPVSVLTGEDEFTSPSLEITIEGPAHVKLSWDSIPDSTGYSIYRNENWLSSSPDNQYTDLQVQSGSEYTYTVYSYQSDNSVYSSDTLTATVAVPDGENSNQHTTNEEELAANLPYSETAIDEELAEFGTPFLVLLIEGPERVKLSWDSIPDSTGYSIYRNGSWLSSSPDNQYSDSCRC